MSLVNGKEVLMNFPFMQTALILIIIVLISYLFIQLHKLNRKSKFFLIKSRNGSNNSIDSNKYRKSKQRIELKKMAVDQDHYFFLEGLIEGRISEQEYDKWAHSRKHEGPDVFRKLLKRPYQIRKL